MKNATVVVMLGVLMGGLAVATATAADKIDLRSLDQKTLPADVYTKLTEGKRASLLWHDPGFAVNSPYVVDKIEWLATERNGTILDQLTKQAQSLGAKESAHYRIELRVTSYTPAAIKAFSKNVQPRVIVEAVVFDKSGAVVAAMVTAEKGDLGKHPKADADTYNGMVDKVITALDSELMKGR
jgi:hypothetical protein